MALFRRVRIVANVRVGNPQIAPDAPSHVPGVKAGNAKRRLFQHGPGIRNHKSGARGSARRSTGIRPLRHNAIIPFVMPNLSPA